MIINHLKSYLNSLKCPICGAPIDLFISDFQYGCANDRNHYHLNLIKTQKLFGSQKLESVNEYSVSEYVNIYCSGICYTISKIYDNNLVKTTIIFNKTDGENRMIFDFNPKKLELNFDAFDFKNFNVEKALNRIKTLSTFQ